MKMVKALLIFTLALTFVFTFIPIADVEAARPTLLKIGSSNGDVWDLQYRLQQLGYNIKIDGIFGTETYQTVISFQKNYGLVSDGIVGPITWTVLKKKSLL